MSVCMIIDSSVMHGGCLYESLYTKYDCESQGVEVM